LGENGGDLLASIMVLEQRLCHALFQGPLSFIVLTSSAFGIWCYIKRYTQSVSSRPRMARARFHMVWRDLWRDIEDRSMPDGLLCNIAQWEQCSIASDAAEKSSAFLDRIDTMLGR
jgi:hypothetical protein